MASLTANEKGLGLEGESAGLHAPLKSVRKDPDDEDEDIDEEDVSE